MNDATPDARLDAALRTLREQSLYLETPHAVEDALLTAFAQHHRPKPSPRWWHGFRLGAAMLLTLLVLTLPFLSSAPTQPANKVEDHGDFLALVPGEDIAREAAPQLVETEVTRTALAGLGVPLSPDNAGDLVRAQFLVGADGRPLALRLLPAVSDFPLTRG